MVFLNTETDQNAPKTTISRSLGEKLFCVCRGGGGGVGGGVVSGQGRSGHQKHG